MLPVLPVCGPCEVKVLVFTSRVHTSTNTNTGGFHRGVIHALSLHGVCGGGGGGRERSMLYIIYKIHRFFL